MSATSTETSDQLNESAIYAASKPQPTASNKPVAVEQPIPTATGDLQAGMLAAPRGPSKNPSRPSTVTTVAKHVSRSPPSSEIVAASAGPSLATNAASIATTAGLTAAAMPSTTSVTQLEQRTGTSVPPTTADGDLIVPAPLAGTPPSTLMAANIATSATTTMSSTTPASEVEQCTTPRLVIVHDASNTVPAVPGTMQVPGPIPPGTESPVAGVCTPHALSTPCTLVVPASATLVRGASAMPISPPPIPIPVGGSNTDDKQLTTTNGTAASGIAPATAAPINNGVLTNDDMPPSAMPSTATTMTDAPLTEVPTMHQLPQGRFVDDAAVSAAFPASGAAATQLASKLTDVRAVAATRDFYLAHGADTIRGITWIKDGGSHIVIHRAPSLDYTEACAAHAAQPSLNPSPPTPDLAHLYVIGNISMDCCFLQSDGNFNAPSTTFKCTLVGTTLVCGLVAPPDKHAFLVEEYDRGIKTLKAIIHGDVATPWDGVTFKQMKGEHIRMCHKVFRPKSDGDPGPTDLPAKYQTASWPVCEEAKRERATLVDTHFAHPLPAFDVNRNLIPPSNYNQLCGATVLAGVSVTHFTFTGKNTVCLDIEYLRVLIPGSGRRSSTKRGAVQMTDPLSHAAGKHRAV